MTELSTKYNPQDVEENIGKGNEARIGYGNGNGKEFLRNHSPMTKRAS